ncbi:MAG: hypothetical protein K2Z81_11600 [Cyanobacteria bacterium]|nr:hypothetical protein [Cyanobacteriota bacterium]
MKRAELFAKCFDADSDDCCHIFDDGLVLVMACSESRHEQIIQKLIEDHPHHEAARSPDGFASVFLLPSDHVLVGLDGVYGEMEIYEFLDAVDTWTDSKIDHRYRDEYTLAQMVQLVQEAGNMGFLS